MSTQAPHETKPAAIRAAGFLVIVGFVVVAGAAYVTEGFKAAPTWWTVWSEKR